jgi:uncharacterized surface protein with fasciclin (FAS1) repeats
LSETIGKSDPTGKASQMDEMSHPAACFRRVFARLKTPWQIPADARRSSATRYSVKKIYRSKNMNQRSRQAYPFRCDNTHSPSTKENTMFRKTLLSLTAATALATTAFAAGHSKDIVDTAAGAGDFGTLLAAAEAAGLVETLKSEGPFTVFAPTDAAFAALPEGTVEDLLKPENKDALAAILTYHVIAGKVMSTDLTDDMEAATVNGDTVMIDLDNGVMVDDATVTTADIEASNGVIHVIDKVIMPGS